MHKLSIAVPALVVGCLASASLTTVARAKEPAQVKVYDYAVATSPAELKKYGAEGYAIVNVVPASQNGGWPYWTMQRK